MTLLWLSFTAAASVWESSSRLKTVQQCQMLFTIWSTAAECVKSPKVRSRCQHKASIPFGNKILPLPYPRGIRSTFRRFRSVFSRDKQWLMCIAGKTRGNYRVEFMYRNCKRVRGANKVLGRGKKPLEPQVCTLVAKVMTNTQRWHPFKFDLQIIALVVLLLLAANYYSHRGQQCVIFHLLGDVGDTA